MAVLFRRLGRVVSPLEVISAGGGVSPRGPSPEDTGSGELGENKAASMIGAPRSQATVTVAGGLIAGEAAASILIAGGLFDLGLGRSCPAFDLMRSALAAAISSVMTGLAAFFGELTSLLVLFAPRTLRRCVEGVGLSRDSFRILANSFNVFPPAFSRIDDFSAITRGGLFSSVIRLIRELSISSLADNLRFDPILIG